MHRKLLSEAFKKAKDEGHGPKRSILFLHLTGEEIGKQGSQYYTQHPILPLENTIANLNNIDGVLSVRVI